MLFATGVGHCGDPEFDPLGLVGTWNHHPLLHDDYPDHVSLPNGWGHHGWTTLQIDHIGHEITAELIDTSIRTIASMKLTGR
jgi:hypothetical protein